MTLTGSGFTPSSTGNILECNNDPNEPNVALGAPVNNPVGVGCTAPSLSASALTSTSASGTVSKQYPVAGGTVGPPCGATGDLITTCPATDSSGGSPAADAAKYPCPPTPAQQAAGVVCVINFGDQAGDSGQVTILFQGESAPSSTTTSAAATATTAAPTTTRPSSATTAPASHPATAAASGTLAYTGPGLPLLWTALLAAVLIAAGLFLLLVPPRLAASGGRRR